jgi:hypothetical protein
MWLWIAIGIVLLIGAIIGIILLGGNGGSGGSSTTSTASPPQRQWTPPSDFKVYNYLPNHSIKVSVLDPDTNETTSLVDNIKPLQTGGIAKSLVEKHLKPGNVLRVYIVDTLGCSSHFTDHVVDTSCYDRIKNLHIGMVTTRFIGKTTDGLRMSTLADNAIQGHAWLMIHNLTELPLRLNDDIFVEPHSTFRYLGYLHQGVTLGTIFKDQDGVYPDFQYLNPHSDLYYGVVSDLRQPLYGPFQLEFSDECDTDQTLWPFELGQM